MKIAAGMIGAGLIVAAAATSALASIEVVGDPIEGNSFCQRWRRQGERHFDHVQVRMDTPGGFKTIPDGPLGAGINEFGDSSWSQLFNTGSLLAARGNSLTSLLFNLVYTNDWRAAETFDFHFQTYLGDCRLDNIRICKLAGGTGWDFLPGTWTCTSPISTPSGPVPEPCSLIVWSLLAALGVGAGFWRRRMVS